MNDSMAVWIDWSKIADRVYLASFPVPTELKRYGFLLGRTYGFPRLRKIQFLFLLESLKVFPKCCPFPLLWVPSQKKCCHAPNLRISESIHCSRFGLIFVSQNHSTITDGPAFIW